MVVVVKTNGMYHFGVGAPPILEPILVGIAILTGGTIWFLTHGHIMGLPETMQIPSEALTHLDKETAGLTLGP